MYDKLTTAPNSHKPNQNEPEDDSIDVVIVLNSSTKQVKTLEKYKY